MTFQTILTQEQVEEMQGFSKGKGVPKRYRPGPLEILEELPKTPSGKIRRFELPDLVKENV